MSEISRKNRYFFLRGGISNLLFILLFYLIIKVLGKES